MLVLLRGREWAHFRASDPATRQMERETSDVAPKAMCLGGHRVIEVEESDRQRVAFGTADDGMDR